MRRPFRSSAALATVAVLVLAGCGGGGGPTVPLPTTTPAPTSEAPVLPPPTTTAAPQGAFRFQPLWPFENEEAAADWQEEFQASGAQPWHLDPEETALAFAAALGFTELDSVVGEPEIAGDEAWVPVGYVLPEGEGRAADVHLARLGSGSADGVDAPWEVVGTRDTDLTLEEPNYGSTVSSPVAVGGEITGVDESLDVAVFQAGSEQPLGRSCCSPAGGEDAPWEVEVGYEGAADAPLILVVATGGHVADVERFAITGVLPV